MKKRGKKKPKARPHRKAGSPSAAKTITPAPASSEAAYYNPVISYTLIWVGSTLTALTFLGGLQTVIDFSPWASWILRNWLKAVEGFWMHLFQSLGMRFHRDGIIPGTFIFAMFFIGVGAMTLSERKDPNESAKTKNISWKGVLWHSLFDEEVGRRRAEGLAMGLAIALATISVFNWYLFESLFNHNDLTFWWMKWVLIAATPAIFNALYFARSTSDFLHLILLTASMSLLYLAMLIPAANAARARGSDELWSLAFMVANLSVVLFPTKMMSMAVFAKPRHWNYRMLYVWLTIALVLALDWVARNSISLKPPAA